MSQTYQIISYVSFVSFVSQAISRDKYPTSLQHPDQQRYNKDDDKKRRAKAAQKMMHGDLFLRDFLILQPNHTNLCSM